MKEEKIIRFNSEVKFSHFYELKTEEIIPHDKILIKSLNFITYFIEFSQIKKQGDIYFFKGKFYLNNTRCTGVETEGKINILPCGKFSGNILENFKYAQ